MGRDFGKESMVRDPTPQEGKQDKGNHIGGRDVKTVQPPDNERSHPPNNEQRNQVVSPLNAQARHSVRSQKEHGRDAEVGGVPDVASIHPEHILRGDGDHGAERIGPELGRAYEDADTDAGNIRAGEMRDLAGKDFTQHHLRYDTCRDGEQGLRIAFQHTLRQLRHEQDTGDQDRRDKPDIDAIQFLRQRVGTWRRRVGGPGKDRSGNGSGHIRH